MADNRTAALRRGLIATIHIAKGQMGLDDDAYQGLLESVTGHKSSAKCTVPQLKAVIAEMRNRKGWTPRPLAGQVPVALRPLHNKIAALCTSLDRPLSYAESIISRQTKNSATLGTADRAQLTACVAALVRQQRREKTSTHA